MQKSDSQNAQKTHRKVQASTTLNRKYVKRPSANTKVKVRTAKSPMISHFNHPEAQQVGQVVSEAVEQPVAIQQPAKTQLQTSVNERMRQRNATISGQTSAKATKKKLSAKELKDQAIQKALVAANTKQNRAQKIDSKRSNKIHFGFGRVVLALACTTAAVFAIVYFVNLNMPDLSLRVAAMQTGIDASYPNYVPRGYSISSITSESGKIAMAFTDNENNGTFTIVEEKSSWDSNALLSNYVEPEYKDNYTVVREQGLSIYVSGSNAAWVNGGKVFKITTTSGSLTNKQIKAIATSL